MHGLLRAGSPIRRPAGRRVCAPNRGLSQLAASFVGSMCQGIRRAPCVSCPARRRGAVSIDKRMYSMRWVPHTPRGDVPPGGRVATYPSLNSNHVADWISLLAKKKNRSDLMSRSVSRYAALKAPGVLPGTGRCDGGGQGRPRGTPAPQLVRYPLLPLSESFSSLERR